MDSFIKLSNFGKIAPYAQLFRQGTSGNCTAVSFYSSDRLLYSPCFWH